MKRFGRIYKITNNINGKSYIGQTKRDLKIRINRHFSDAKKSKDNYLIHVAIRKYGEDNFETCVIEDNIPLECLDERECYWINYYHTYIGDKNCNGYNMTRGGNSMLVDAIRKLTDDEIEEVKYLLKYTALSEKEISKRYNVSFFLISDINIGKCWFDNNAQYPLRSQDVKKLDEAEFIKIIEMLRTGLFSLNYITDKFSISQSTVSNINTGKYRKFKYPSNITFPIAAAKTVSNTKISIKDELLLINDYISSNITKKELAQKYNISEAYVKAIIGLTSAKHYLSDLKKPVRFYMQENQKNIQEKIALYEKYK